MAMRLVLAASAVLSFVSVTEGLSMRANSELDRLKARRQQLQRELHNLKQKNIELERHIARAQTESENLDSDVEQEAKQVMNLAEHLDQLESASSTLEEAVSQSHGQMTVLGGRGGSSSLMWSSRGGRSGGWSDINGKMREMLSDMNPYLQAGVDAIMHDAVRAVQSNRSENESRLFLQRWGIQMGLNNWIGHQELGQQKKQLNWDQVQRAYQNRML